MSYENKNFSENRNNESLYSKRIKAGKRRTYFFDVRSTRGNDYFITITESKKRFDDNGYDRHKMFLYKEDFNKFLKGMTEAIDYVKTELMPDFDFDAFNHENSENYEGNSNSAEVKDKEENVEASSPETEQEAPKIAATEIPSVTNSESPETKASDEPENPTQHEEVDKW